jgi:YspA, cpYpsA-related SLOG family
MKTIICGSRDCWNPKILNDALDHCGWTPTLVISGCARGADLLGEQWATANNIPILRFPAQWNKYGKSAGYLRNKEMLKEAEAVIALWDGRSKGTEHMIKIAAKSLRIHIQVYQSKPLA